MKNVERILTAVGVVIAAWVMFSFIDVNLHNLPGANYGLYSTWNLFAMIFN